MNVGVVLPCCSAGAALGWCLPVLHRQEFATTHSVEVFVGDDSSTDGTATLTGRLGPT